MPDPTPARTRPATFNLADLWEAVSDLVPTRTAAVCGDTRRTYAELEERANRLANWMVDQGVEAGQHVGLYLTNGIEYLEAMLACFKIRAVPINVNYRYVAGELRYLFDDADVVGVLVQPDFLVRLAEVVPDLPAIRWSLAVGDEYEAALAESSPERAFPERSGDDRY
ncbi:MAG: AMP-binding protein, partial [Acidimicrobiales bacterium]